MSNLLQDLRHGLRTLKKNPGFMVVVVLTLALGIGANTAIFSVVNAVLLQPLPYRDSHQLMMVWETNPSEGKEKGGCSPPDFREWKSRNRVFDEMAAFSTIPNQFNFTGGDMPEQITGADISANLLTVLGVNPVSGRSFLPEEETFGQHRVVILSYGLWQRRFGAADVVGQTIILDGELYTIAGVMPSGFHFPDDKTELWTPLAFPPESPMNTRRNHFLGVVARLKAGIAPAQAQAEMDGISSQLEQEFKENAGLKAAVSSLRSEVVGQIEPVLWVLLGAVAFVLLIACANVANLLLARSSIRRREFAIRNALGASRIRIIRQLLTESALLGLFGGAMGLLLAWAGVSALIGFAPADLPRLNDISVDGRVLIFTLALSLLTGMVFGLAPTLQTLKQNPGDALKEGGRGTVGEAGSRRFRSALIVAEAALSLILLIGAGLMLKSFLNLSSIDLGFNPKCLLTMQVMLPGTKYPGNQPERKEAFFNELIGRIRAMPGVKSVGATTSLPLTKAVWIRGKNLSIENRPPARSLDEVPSVRYAQVTPDYFSTMGIPLIKGRLFNEQDRPDNIRVALINETSARRFWPGEDPVGQQIWLGPPENLVSRLPPGYKFPRITIAGIVGDVKGDGLGETVEPEVYLLHAQVSSGETSRNMSITIRTAGDPISLAAAARNQVWEIDRDQPVADIATMEARLSGSLAQPRFNTLLLALFAAAAMLLAVIGIYGMIAYWVTQRTHEIGVRLALGAQRRDVLKLVVGQGLRLIATGIAIGLGGAWALTRLMESLLFGVSATDPATFAVVSSLLFGAALLACLIPARRAARVDPCVALRYE